MREGSPRTPTIVCLRRIAQLIVNPVARVIVDRHDAHEAEIHSRDASRSRHSSVRPIVESARDPFQLLVAHIGNTDASGPDDLRPTWHYLGAGCGTAFATMPRGGRPRFRSGI